MSLDAQTNLYTITNSQIEYDKKLRPCLSTSIDLEPKTVKKAWYSYLKKNYKVKLSGIGFLSNKELLTGEKVKIPVISNKQIDFFTNVTESSTGSDMKVFVAFGYDIFISPEKYPVEYDALKKS